MAVSYPTAPGGRVTQRNASTARAANTRTGNVQNVSGAQRQRLTAPAPAPSPAAPPPPAYTPPPVDNGTGQVEYGAVTLDNPAPAMPDVSVEALTKSPEYLARERALAAAMDLFGASQATEKARYEENYGKSLGELGYDPTSAKWDLGELMSSGQKATTSGKAYNALRNDFAARGMLQSGAYQAQRGVLSNQLASQLADVQGSRTKFLEDQQARLLAQQAQNESARQAALDAAKQAILDRFAAGGA